MSVTFNVRTATGPELLKFFNANTGGAQVTKFRDRLTAEKRVQRLVDEMKAEEMVEEMGIKSSKEAAKLIAAALAPTVIVAEAARALGRKLAVTEPADRLALVKATYPQPAGEMRCINPEAAPSQRIWTGELATFCSNINRDSTKPWQRAKVIICDMLEAGKTSRKEIIAACVAAGIKYNTADGCHYEMCVKGRTK